MFLIGLSLMLFSLPMAIVTIRNIYLVNEYPNMYRYAEGMNDESAVIRATIFVILVSVGIALMIAAWIKRRNKATLDTIVNAQSQSFCPTCGINVSAPNTHCPICGRQLK